VSHNLHGRTLHSVINFDVSLQRAEVLMPGKLHDDLGRDAAVGELGDKAAPGLGVFVLMMMWPALG